MRVTRWTLSGTGAAWIMYITFLGVVAPEERSALHSGLVAALVTGSVLVGTGALARWAVRRVEAIISRDRAPDYALDPATEDAIRRMERRLGSS